MGDKHHWLEADLHGDDLNNSFVGVRARIERTKRLGLGV